MKVTVWRQFSSNHSAMYTIVGVFPSLEEAQRAGEKIRTIVERIAKDAEETKPSGMLPSDYEQQVGIDYGFEWKQAVDWLRYFPRHYREIYQREPSDYVLIIDKLVIVDAPSSSSTWQTGHQFVNLINAIGGKSFSDVYMGENPDDNSYFGASIFVDLDCIAPSNEVALDIYKTLSFESSRRWRLPWAKYVANFDYYCKFAAIQDFDKVETQWIRETNAWREFFEQNKLDYDALRKQTLTAQAFRELEKEKREELFSHQSEFIHLDEKTVEAMYAIYREAGSAIGKILIEGNKIQLFGADRGIIWGGMMAWLRSLGCEVSYEFRQED